MEKLNLNQAKFKESSSLAFSDLRLQWTSEDSNRQVDWHVWPLDFFVCLFSCVQIFKRF